MNDLVRIVSSGVPTNAIASEANLHDAIDYGNQRSANEHLPLISEKVGEYVRREKCLVFTNAAAPTIPNLRVSTRTGRDTQGSNNP